MCAALLGARVLGRLLSNAGVSRGPIAQRTNGCVVFVQVHHPGGPTMELR